MTTSPFAILAVIGACVLGAYASVLMKKASAKLSFSPGKLIRNTPLILSVFLYGVSTLIFIPALRYGELSVLSPFIATTYIWVSFFSIRFLHEKMNFWKWAGIALILIGVGLVGLGS